MQKVRRAWAVWRRRRQRRWLHPWSFAWRTTHLFQTNVARLFTLSSRFEVINKSGQRTWRRVSSLYTANQDFRICYGTAITFKHLKAGGRWMQLALTPKCFVNVLSNTSVKYFCQNKNVSNLPPAPEMVHGAGKKKKKVHQRNTSGVFAAIDEATVLQHLFTSPGLRSFSPHKRATQSDEVAWSLPHAFIWNAHFDFFGFKFIHRIFFC